MNGNPQSDRAGYRPPGGESLAEHYSASPIPRRPRRPQALVWIACLTVGLGWAGTIYGQANRGPNVVREAEIDQGPRGMLQVMRIDESQLQFFRDDRPLVEEENETLRQLLFRLPTFSRLDIERWSQPLHDWQGLLEDPEPLRFEFFQLQGEVVGVRAIEVIPEMVSRLRFRQYFALTIQSDDQTSLALVRFIPSAWQKALRADTPIRESVRLDAMLLKRMPIGEQTGLVFAASRVGWHPTRANPELGVSNDHVLLGQLGLDISRLEEVQQKQGMQALDRECFYQSLAAVRLARPELLARIGRREFDISRMIETPEQAVGEWYTLRGKARRAVLIRVEDPDIQTRFGIDHYYEVEIFLPLDKNVRFVDPGDPKGKLFTEYPFVVCVPELPPGMRTGEDVHVPVTFSGFFLKVWAYRTQFMTGDQRRTDRPRLQLSPLLIGPTLVVEPQAFASAPYLGLALALLFTGCLLAIWFVLWRLSVGDRKFAKATLFRNHEVKGDELRTLREPRDA